MEFSIKPHTIKSGYHDSLYILSGHSLKFPRIIVFLSLKVDFVSANIADPVEMPHYVAFYMGLHCFENKYLLRGFGIHRVKGGFWCMCDKYQIRYVLAHLSRGMSFLTMW